jgi:hypothetical protein
LPPGFPTEVLNDTQRSGLVGGSAQVVDGVEEGLEHILAELLRVARRQFEEAAVALGDAEADEAAGIIVETRHVLVAKVLVISPSRTSWTPVQPEVRAMSSAVIIWAR